MIPARKLGEVAAPAGAKAGRATDLPVYSVTKHRGFVPSLEYFKKQVFSRDLAAYQVVEPGEFAYATIHLDEGSIGIAPERCLISPMYTAFKIVDPAIHAPYLVRFLKSERALTEYPRFGQGSAERRRSISFERLAELEVPLPSIEEQRRIGGILDRADALRVKRREALAHLDDFTQSIFLDMFAAPLPEWPELTVGDLTDEAAGGMRTGPFGSQLLHSEFVDSGVAVLGIDNAVQNEFRWGAERFITEDRYRQLRRYTVRPGDVLITIMGTCGRAAIVPDDIPVAINTKHLCCISVDRGRCLPEYLHAHFLSHPSARSYLERTAKGAIMSGLNMGIIKAMPISVPPMGLQVEFVRDLRGASLVAERLRASRTALGDLFAALQQRGFAGLL